MYYFSINYNFIVTYLLYSEYIKTILLNKIIKNNFTKITMIIIGMCNIYGCSIHLYSTLQMK